MDADSAQDEHLWNHFHTIGLNEIESNRLIQINRETRVFEVKYGLGWCKDLSLAPGEFPKDMPAQEIIPLVAPDTFACQWKGIRLHP